MLPSRWIYLFMKVLWLLCASFVQFVVVRQCNAKFAPIEFIKLCELGVMPMILMGWVDKHFYQLLCIHGLR